MATMLKIVPIIGFLIGTLNLAAQDFNHYVPMTCSGKIPDEIIVKSSKKYKADIAKLKKKSSSKSNLKNRKQFALESNFVLDHMLESGLVLFNDPISLYLNEVAKQLVVDDKKLEKVKVYTLRSGSVNAFATDRGTVFVTLGLLAQLENEAQLAFILAHELTHVEQKHTLNMFLESKDIEKNMSRKRVLNESRFDEAMIAKNRYSKELETEADQKGMERFLKTGYSSATVDVVFDVLKYAYLPFDDVKFQRSFLEYDAYVTPDALWATPVSAIKGEDESADNQKSSHPNIGARRKIVAETLAKAKRPTGKNFLVSEERFKTVQKMARFELPVLHLHHGQLPEAVYTSYLLLEKDPNSAYLKECLVKALYYQAKFKNDTTFELSDRTAEIEGESQQVHRLLAGLDAQELLVLALREAWKLQLEYPENPEIKDIADDLFVELARHVSTIADFKNALAPALATPETPDTTTAPETDKSDSEKTKYDKIKEQQTPGQLPAEGWTYGFVKFVGDSSFVKAFDAGQAAYKKRLERYDYYTSDKGRKELAKQQERDRTKGQRLGIKKVVVVNPFYLRLDERKKDNMVQFVPSESGQENLRELMEEVSPRSGLKMTMLDISALKETETERFNDIRLLNDWFSEQVHFDDLSLTPGTEQARINAIAQKYDSDYFLWTGVISLRERKTPPILSILVGVVYPIVLPYAVYKTVTPEYDMLYYAVLFDVKTGRRRTVKMEYFNKQDTNTLLKAHIFDTLKQISTEDK